MRGAGDGEDQPMVMRSLSTASATLIVLATYLLLVAAVVATAQVVPIRF